jgi:PASTA domain
MSDERDETRRYPSADRPDGTTPSGRPASGDRTRADGPRADDRTRIHRAEADDGTRIHRAEADDGTRIHRAEADEDTRVHRPGDDDWAGGRGNAWTGRAEVRSPGPDASSYETDWAAGASPVQRDRWWMPIVLGIVVLILLAALGWGVYVIVQNSGEPGSPGPAPTATLAPSTEPTATTASETAPATESTTTPPAPEPSITEPVQAEVTVPALRGLALADAQAALTRTGLRSRLIFRDSDAPPNTVIDSDPAEGQEVPPNTVVTLVVAKAATTTPTAAPTTAGQGDGAGDRN